MSDKTNVSCEFLCIECNKYKDVSKFDAYKVKKKKTFLYQTCKSCRDVSPDEKQRKIEVLKARQTSARQQRRVGEMISFKNPAIRKEILNIYLKARQIQKDTGIKQHVDHIIPLVSEYVCGLHLPQNLQNITSKKEFK